jgi:Flp pilus assembly protein TadD
MDPEQVRGLLAAAETLLRQQRFADAIHVLQGCAQEAPDDIEIITALARLLAMCPDESLRDGPQAVRLAEHACQLTDWLDPVALHTVSAAYYAVGRTDDAIRAARQALELATEKDLPVLMRRIQGALRLYEAATTRPTITSAPAPVGPIPD